jgi:FixJ family two-component response regulator
MLDHLALRRRSGAPLPLRPAIPLRPPQTPTSVAIVPAAEAGFPVYLVEADRSLRIALTRDLSAAGFELRPFADADDLAAALPELAPGCVVVDIAAVRAGAAALRDQGAGGTLSYPTILLFSSLEPEDAIAAVRLGAADLLPRPLALHELVAALRRAEPKVRGIGSRIAARRAQAAVATLTPRERQVMDCMTRGLSNKETARALGISPRTVEMHRARLYRRLEVRSQAELLALAWRARSAGGG